MSTTRCLNSITSSITQYGADFYYTNSSQAVSSAHIVATISKSLTAAKAEELLQDLTKNASGGRIGNNVTISTTSALYLLHLPRDVLSSVPSLIDNEGMGNMPDYLNMEGILSDIGDFLFDSFVFIFGGGFLFLLLHMAEMGLKKLGQMLSAAATVVKNAVDEMAKALNDMLDWVIDFVTDIIHAMIDPVIGPLNDMFTEYGASLGNALVNAYVESLSTGDICARTMDDLNNALYGGFLILIEALVTMVNLVLIAIEVVTNVFGFIISLAASIMFGYIASEAFQSTNLGSWDGATPSNTGTSAMQACLLSVEGSKDRDTRINWGWSFSAFPIKVLNLILSFAMALYAYKNVLAMSCLIANIIGFALGSYSNMASFNGPTWISTFIGTVAFILGAETFILTLFNIATFQSTTVSFAQKIAILILSMFFSGTAMLLGAKGAGYY